MSDDRKKMDRRSFFRLGMRKAASRTVDLAEARAKNRRKNFIRPPFALSELDFLLKCTRCAECIVACPYQTIFPLTAKLGIDLLSTPALDLLNKACHLCADWPCVTACQTGALSRKAPFTEPESSKKQITADENVSQEFSEKQALPKLAMARIDPEHCLPFSGPECGACASACPVEGALQWDMTKPRINPEVCTGCARCREVCITYPKAIKIQVLPVVE